MSLPKVTQKNVHLFFPMKVAKVVSMFSEKHHVSEREALIYFYNSKTYKILEREETKLWYEGPTYLFMALEMEKNGEELHI